jgi:pimeloyl-ACP methyl ester carboxylesterase
MLEQLATVSAGAAPLPALLLIHGLGSSVRSWDRLVPLLASTFHVVRVDLPGYNASRGLPPATTIEQMADAVQPIAERLDRPVVIGHSMGGLVATALAERSAALLDRIVVVNSSLTLASRMSMKQSSEALIRRPIVGRFAWAAAPRTKLRDGLRTAFAPDYDVPEQFVDDLRRTSWATFTRSGAAINDYLLRRPLAERLAGTDVPATVIFGVQDQRNAPDALGEFRGCCSANVVEIPEAGHTPIWETPETVARAIRWAAGRLGPSARQPIT